MLQRDMARDLLLRFNRAVNFVVNDNFSTTQAAPIGATYNAIPGPGILTRSADSADNVDINNSTLQIAGTASNYADPAYYWTDKHGNGFARAGGYLAVHKLIFPDSSPLVTFAGWTKNTTIANTQLLGVINSGANLQQYKNGSVATIGAVAAGTTYILATLMRPVTGMHYFLIGGAYSDWVHLFLDMNYTDTPMWPAITGAGAGSVRLAFLRVTTDIPNWLLTDNFALVSNATPVSGTIYTGAADTLVRFSYTLGAGAVGKLAEIRYRIQDANNYRYYRIAWNDGTAQWDMSHGSVVATVDTPGGTVANVGGQSTMILRAVGSAHDMWTQGSSSSVARFAGVSNSDFSTETGVGVAVAAGVTVGQFEAYAYQSTALSDALNRVSYAG